MEYIKNTDVLPDTYLIDEYGNVFSKAKNKQLKKYVNNIGYVKIGLRNKDYKLKLYSVHRLVALTYLGVPLPEQTDVNHIDNDKQNNHVSNLEFCTHSDNIKKSYQSGRVHTYTPRKHTKETAKKMAEAKYKKVRCYINDVYKEYNSVEAFCLDNNIYRQAYKRILDNKTPYNCKHIRII